MKESEAFKQGRIIRRRIGGDAYADAVEAAAAVSAEETPGAVNLAKAFTRFSTEHGWGATWPRPGLDMRSRSLATIALFIILGGDRNELKLHVDAALRNKFLTQEEIRELFLQVGGYMGYPLVETAIEKVFDAKP